MTTREKERRLRGRPSVFTAEQKQILMKYYEELDMKSTHKRNAALMEQAATEGKIPLDRVKRFIGAENAKRRRILLNTCNENPAKKSKKNENGDHSEMITEDTKIHKSKISSVSNGQVSPSEANNKCS